MLASSDSYIYDYEKSRKAYFGKYERKIEAIVKNLEMSSTITERDKEKLIKKLSSKLLASIGK